MTSVLRLSRIITFYYFLPKARLIYMYCVTTEIMTEILNALFGKGLILRFPTIT